jgi:phospholipid-binding lipoprotein MlaA
MLPGHIAINKIANYLIKTLAIAVFGLLAGCATGPNANPRDPLEPFNRAMFSFNEGVDRVVAKPAAEVYVAVTPQLLRQGVTNFFSNLGDLWTGVNSALQLSGQKAGESFTRFGVNTFLGLGGLLDVASEAGIPRHREDFGQTLGRWGMPTGPYLVVPLWGPTTVRDAAVIPVDAKGNLVSRINPAADRTAATVLNLVNTRARLLGAERLFNEIALDKYTFARDTFLQRRRNDVFDGDPSKDDSEKDSEKPETGEESENPPKAADPETTKAQ